MNRINIVAMATDSLKVERPFAGSTVLHKLPSSILIP
jgi:hypothetical protein